MSAATREAVPPTACAPRPSTWPGAAAEAAAPGSRSASTSAPSPRATASSPTSSQCKEPGYRGWRWAVTVARASRAKIVTLDETVLLPGPDALLAPEWVPWSERLRPGDMGPGDLLPTEADDLRLEPGYSGEDEPPPNSVVSEEWPSGRGRGRRRHGRAASRRGTIGAVAEELGMGRARVLSRYGLHAAADRWEEQFGPKTPWRRRRPRPASACGFLVPIGGLAAAGVRGVRQRVLARPTAAWSPSRTAAAATPRPRSCRRPPQPAPLVARRAARTAATRCALGRRRGRPRPADRDTPTARLCAHRAARCRRVLSLSSVTCRCPAPDLAPPARRPGGRRPGADPRPLRSPRDERARRMAVRSPCTARRGRIPRAKDRT